MTEIPPAALPVPPEEANTHFGFSEVRRAEKAPLVQGVFRSVAGKYDLMNDVMSLGVHRIWKDALIDWMVPRNGATFLDVAGGTGDIAFRILDNLKGRYRAETSARIIVCDLTTDMLREGRVRAERRHNDPADALTWVTGDAMRLPLPDRSVDVYTIAFGLRNVTDPQQALAEALRVLRPGGRFFCLEFSKVVLPILDQLYERYSFDLLPSLGGMIAGDRASYQYLVESIRQFPDQLRLEGMMHRAGFDLVRHRNLSGGIVAIHSGWRT